MQFYVLVDAMPIKEARANISYCSNESSKKNFQTEPKNAIKLSKISSQRCIIPFHNHYFLENGTALESIFGCGGQVIHPLVGPINHRRSTTQTTLFQRMARQRCSNAIHSLRTLHSKRRSWCKGGSQCQRRKNDCRNNLHGDETVRERIFFFRFPPRRPTVDGCMS